MVLLRRCALPRDASIENKDGAASAPSYEGRVKLCRTGTRQFGITPVTFDRVPSVLTCLELRISRGERVTQSSRGDIARAQRLKKALASGSAPGFVPAQNTAPPAESVCSEKS